MVVIEIPSNPNCASVDTRVFHALSSAQQVGRVRLARQAGEVRWHDVTGWSMAGQSCPAMMQKVDDSGEGVAFLIYGGDAGLRLKPAGHPALWRFEDATQRGEPFLLVSNLSDVQLVQSSDSQETMGESAAHG